VTIPPASNNNNNNANAGSVAPSDKTYRCAIAVTLKKRTDNLELITSEINFAGAFIRTTSAPPLNSLVRLLFTLPPDEAVLDISAHVTNVVAADDVAGDHYPGFVARFVALNGPVKRRWETLVQSLRNNKTASSQNTLVFARASYVMRLQEKGAAAVDLPLRPASFEELENLIEQQIPSGMFFVPTNVPLVLGANVNVQIVHPITNETLEIPGSVVRRGSTAPGALVRLRPMNGDMQAALKEFEESVLVLVDYDIELFEAPILTTAAVR
jgi:hypothetical protein